MDRDPAPNPPARARPAIDDAGSDEWRRKENAFLAGRAPWARVALVAGVVLTCFGAIFTLGIVWPGMYRDREQEPPPIFVAPLVLSGGLGLLFAARARRRRVLVSAEAWTRSFPYPVAGYLEVFGVDWSPTSTRETHPFGRIVVSVQIRGLEGEARLVDALAAVAEGTLARVSDDRWTITSPRFVSGAVAHRWLVRVLDRFVPALHSGHAVTQVQLHTESS